MVWKQIRVEKKKISVRNKELEAIVDPIEGGMLDASQRGAGGLTVEEVD